MGIVGTSFTVSLDGFIAGLDDDVSELFKWYSAGDTDLAYPNGRMTAKVSAASAKIIEDAIQATGALVTGRRLFDLTKGWGGRHPVDVPVVVVTHNVPEGWLYEGSPFTFVTDGVESAIEKAKELAQGKDVAIASANVAQQCLKAGLVDDIEMDIVPVLLGKGIRMYEYLGIEPVTLETTKVVQGTGVTHIRFRVVK